MNAKQELEFLKGQLAYNYISNLVRKNNWNCNVEQLIQFTLIRIKGNAVNDFFRDKRDNALDLQNRTRNQAWRNRISA